MERDSWFIAWRNVSRQLRRFFTIMLACVVGIVIISLIQGVLAGIDRNIYAAAERYYGGDVLVFGTRVVPYHEDYAPAKDRPVLERLARGHEEVVSTNFRMSINAQATLFFDGAGQDQKRVIGIDWDAESSLLREIDLVRHADAAPGDDSIIVSQASAERLKCDVGSSVLVQVKRISGVVDTIRLTVWGVYRDAAVFGPFNCYVSNKALNTVLGNQPRDFFCFALRLRPGVDRLEFAHRFYREMIGQLPTLRFMSSREEYAEKKHWFSGEETHYTAMPVDYTIEQLNQLSGALKIGLYLLMVFVAVTVAIGTFNTYRIMLDERSRELGTMRAIGLSGVGLRNLVLREGLIVAAVGCLAAWLVSLAALGCLSFAPLGNIPGLDLFLDKGRLKPEVGPLQYLADMSIMVLLLEMSAWFAAKRIRDMSPIEAIVRR